MAQRPSRLFTITSALSAVLCVGMMVLWVRSVRHYDVFLQPHQVGDRWLIVSGFGSISIETQGGPVERPKPRWVFIEHMLASDFDTDWRWGHFAIYHGQVQHFLPIPPSPTIGVSVPHWALIALLGALPFWWSSRYRAARRSAARGATGQCGACGYDLRATPDPAGPLFASCPECGAPSAVEKRPGA